MRRRGGELRSASINGQRLPGQRQDHRLSTLLRAYVEGSDDPESELAERRSCFRKWQSARRLQCRKLESKSHTTQPPNRFSEASLTPRLEKMGIGRPSTPMPRSSIRFSPAITSSKKSGNVLAICRSRGPLLPFRNIVGAHLPDLVNYQFTADMEDDLDAISRGELDHVEYLPPFYFGKDEEGARILSTAEVGRDRRPRCLPRTDRPAGREQPEVFRRSRRPLWVRSWSKASAAGKHPRPDPARRADDPEAASLRTWIRRDPRRSAR